MKSLESFFRQFGISPEYGIAYNLTGLKEIKYWDKEGQVNILKEVPQGLEEGIFTFKSTGDELTLFKA